MLYICIVTIKNFTVMTIPSRTESEVNALCGKFVVKTFGKFLLVCLQLFTITSMLWVLLNVLMPLIANLLQSKLA